MIALRPELDPLPRRMKDLPVDRGYPVPWFVEWLRGEDGKLFPEFRAMSMKKWVAAVKKSLCWVCGERLGAHLAFVVGPMCGITRTTSEPPSHLDCAVWSARNCPFLTKPSMERRELSKEYDGVVAPAGQHIERNPGMCLVWVAKEYRVFEDGKGGHLLEMGEPASITCWAEGHPATPEQIEQAITSGVPFLLEKVTEEQDINDIHNLVKIFRARVNLPELAPLDVIQP